MIKVGLTGGIGSGKSTVAKVFEVLRIPVYDADVAAKRLMASDAQVKAALTQTFGEAVFDASGVLQRTYLSDIVFQQPDKLRQLNAIVHPAVATDSAAWLARHQQFPYVIKEAALLYEAGSYRQLDVMICVVAPEKLRIQRVSARDQISVAAVQARMDKQWPQQKKEELADHVIVNDGQQALIPQVMALHRQFTAAASGS